MASSPPSFADRHPSGRPWRVDDFDYELPSAAIAQTPLADRAASRLLVVSAADGRFIHSRMSGVGTWLRPGDLLVANNSRVILARLSARKATGGRVELLLLREVGERRWRALARPAKRLRPGVMLDVLPRPPDADDVLAAVVGAVGADGEIEVAFVGDGRLDLARFGATPLPPYISAPLADPTRYQTVFAKIDGSAAAPTAGLHFTPGLIEALRERGIRWAEVTLHVGLDTFRPVTVECVADHVIHREWCAVSDEAAAAVAATKAAGGRVVAVGTTSARTLEYLGRHWEVGGKGGVTGEADLFITPGYRWRVVDGLLTNFHTPRSTLMMIVGALAGVETIRTAYAAALAEGYRFLSFGDAMLILPDANQE